MATTPERAAAAYDSFCSEGGFTPDDNERQQWIDEWDMLESEAREDAAQAQRAAERETLPLDLGPDDIAEQTAELEFELKYELGFDPGRELLPEPDAPDMG